MAKFSDQTGISLNPVQQKKGFQLTDLIPIGGSIIGGLLGTAAGPIGSIGGSAAGGALAEALREQLTGENFNSGKVISEGAQGLAGGVSGEILGAGARFGTELATKGAESAAENLANRSSGFTPTLAKNFYSEQGVFPGRTLYNEDLLGKGVEGIADKKAQLNSLYKDALDNVKVDPTTYDNVFNANINSNRSLAAPGKQALANQLEENAANVRARTTKRLPDYNPTINEQGQLLLNSGNGYSVEPSLSGPRTSSLLTENNMVPVPDNIAKKTFSQRLVPNEVSTIVSERPTGFTTVGKTSDVGAGSFTPQAPRERILASDLNTQKSGFYDNAPAGSFLDANTANANNVTGDILKSIIDGSTTNGETKILGKRLQALYTLEDGAKAAAAKAALKSPGALTNINGGITGALLTGGNPVGAAAGAGISAILNSSSAAGLAGKGLFKVADVLGSQTAGKLAENGGRIAAQLSRAISPVSAQDTTDQQSYLPDSIGATTQANNQTQQQSPADKITQLAPILIQDDLKKTGGKNITKIQAIVKAYQDAYPSTANKTPTATQAKNQAFADKAAAADQILVGNQPAYDAQGGISNYIQSKLPDVLNGVKSGTTQSNEQAQRAFVNAILRQESGAAISPSEFDNYRSQFFPLPGDSARTIAQKAASRKVAIQALVDQGSATPDYQPVALGQ